MAVQVFSEKGYEFVEASRLQNFLKTGKYFLSQDEFAESLREENEELRKEILKQEKEEPKVKKPKVEKPKVEKRSSRLSARIKAAAKETKEAVEAVEDLKEAVEEMKAKK
jgi:hypothetical protein